MRKAHFTNKAARGAFTLIEILVVLVIMGFLVSMVAPKLSGIVDTAIDTTCDTNQQRLRAVMADWTKMNSTLPSGLTNLVFSTNNAPGSTDYTTTDQSLLTVSDNDKTNGAEVLAEEFVNRWLPTLHYLNDAEATELKGMVGAAVLNYALVTGLTEGDASTGTIVEKSFRSPVKNTLPVMMIGAGFDKAGDAQYATGATVTLNGSTVTVDETTPVSTATADSNILAAAGTGGSNYQAADKTYARIAEAPMALRILMGLSNRNSLVTSGILDESGICPGQVKAADQFEYGNYVLVLPRLQATVDRFLDAEDGTGTLQLANGVALADAPNLIVHAIGFNENDDGTFELTARTPYSPAANGLVTGVNLVATDLESVETSCPEGHLYGARADWFGIAMARGAGKTVK